MFLQSNRRESADHKCLANFFFRLHQKYASELNGAERDREEIEIGVETEVNFELKLFYDENFAIEFDENSPIDISVDSLQEKNLKIKHN